MGKRKRIKDKEDLEKELSKLRRKIDKLAEYKYNVLEENGSLASEAPEQNAVCSKTPEPESPEIGSPEPILQEDRSPQLVVPVPEVQAEEPTASATEQDVSNIEATIDSEILTAMGTVDEEPIIGPPVHSEIAQRWAPILTKGLKKEEKALLTKQYVPFNNVPAMVPPKLNPEVSAAITDPVKKRDNIIENRQKQVATALTAIGCGLQCFLTKGNKVDGIKNFNDAAKLLCDIFHWESGSRRILIQNVVNKDMKESLQDEPDTFLFGKGLSEKIRTTKAVQKSAQDLAKNSNTNKQNKTNITKSLNWRAPPQQGYKQNNYRQYFDSKHQSGGGKRKQKTYEPKKGMQVRPLQQNQRNYRK